MRYEWLLLSIFLFISCNKTQNTTEVKPIKETSVVKVEETSKIEVKETTKEIIVAKIEETSKTEIKEAKWVKYKWEGSSTSYSGMYNSNKYTKEEIINTSYLCYSYNGLIDINVTPYKIADIGTFNTKKLDEKYKQQKQRLSLPIVKTEFMENFRKEKIKELDEEYDLKKITIEADKNPKVLLDSKYASKCKEYVDALTSEDTTKLFDAWEKIIDISIQEGNNLVKAKYKKEKDSADNLAYAKIYVMTYGWWNCANHNMFRVENNGKCGEEFQKLFTNLESQYYD